MQFAIDLNCDMGESFGAWCMGDDDAILPWVTSANVACGFHAGDPHVMDLTVSRALDHQVAVGAHPAFPDLVGFGRRNMSLTYEEVLTDVLYQLGALNAFCRRHGVSLQHVKPHGQLNNLAVQDASLAAAIAEAVAVFDPALIVVAYGGELMRAARQRGLATAQEVYADRAYDRNGLLVPRHVPGSVLHDPGVVVARALRMVVEGCIDTVDGGEIPVRADTICLHGDTPGAAMLAERLRAGLEQAGVAVLPLREVVAGRVD